jgi:hypothetical protein
MMRVRIYCGVVHLAAWLPSAGKGFEGKPVTDRRLIAT